MGKHVPPFSYSFLRNRIILLGVLTPFSFLVVNAITDVCLGYPPEDRFPFGMYLTIGFIIGASVKKRLFVRQGFLVMTLMSIIFGLASLVSLWALSILGGNCVCLPSCMVLFEQQLVVSLILTGSFIFGLIIDKFDLDR